MKTIKSAYVSSTKSGTFHVTYGGVVTLHNSREEAETERDRLNCVTKATTAPSLPIKSQSYEPPSTYK